jgi:TolB protein
MKAHLLHGRARRAAVVGTILAAVSGALLTAACTASRPAVPPGTSTAPAPSGAGAGQPADAGHAAGLSGWLYYVDRSSGRLLRLTSSGLVQVLGAGGTNANVSPDGRRVASIDEAGDVLVADSDGAHQRTVFRGSTPAGYEPAWAPDSGRLLVVRALAGGMTVPGVVDVNTGGFTPLPHNPYGIHYLWSADGGHLGYATGICQLGVAGIDGDNARLVPVIGDRNPSVNPDRKRSCDPFSLSPDGSRMAVDLHGGNTEDGDVGRNLSANAVIDTRTGASVRLPVTGTVTAVLFQPDGGMLVRTRSGATNLLTLISPTGTVTDHITEPTTTKDLDLIAYTT